MKSILRRITALALCAVLLCSTALASDALGGKIYGYTLDICDDTTLTREVMWSSSRSDLRTENYVTYKPSDSISPVVSFGSSIPDKQTVTSMAKALEKNGRRVLSGINGDYFVMATGDPLGIVITDGVLRSSASYLHAIGFNADGSAVIGTPNLSLMADFKGQSLKIADINKIRTNTGFYLFTDDFGNTTKNTQKGVDVILAPNTPGDQLKIGGTVSCTVEQVIEASGATAIPDGKFIMSISNKSGEWLQETIRSLQVGDTVDINISSEDTRWNNVQHAVGAMYWILKDGKVDTSISDGASAPRTAVGVKPDGSVVFYTIDGRQSGLSVGATIQMVAQRLQELGCENAVLLDGGGSTTLVSTYPDFGTSSTINSPSEGTPRSVSNAIFLLSNLNPTGTAGSLYVTPKSLTLLPGATTQCVASAMDTGWYPMDTLPGDVTWSSADNAVSASGLFTAPAAPGVYQVSAESGGVTGSTNINVLQADAIYVTNEATGKNVSTLSLSPGQKVNLSAAASCKTIDLTGGDECFAWTADPAIGTITSDGLFTAGSNTASGKIKVASGNYAVTISVSVTAPAKSTLLSDFEGSDPGFSAQNATLSLNDTQVRYGSQSLQVAYQNDAKLTASRTLTQADRYVSLWVYGDGSGSILSAAFSYEDGTPVTQSLATLNFTGWKQVSAAVPEGAVSFDGLSLSASQKGTLWLDQVVLSNENTWDTTAPTVSLSVSGTSATAKITDNLQGGLAADRMTLKVDGQPVPFQWDAASGTLSATLSGLGKSSHQVTVTAADTCGNLARDSVTLSGASSNPFADMTNHWARTYTARLSELGIISGITSGDVTNFYPNRNITRGDFALMAANWLGLDLNAYASVSLPYTDTKDIPSWDLNAVKALYELGIMQGSRANDGTLRANARASITRAEAMTILGRMTEKGYPQAALSAFSDAAAVPSWAKEHVATLVGMEVVGGSNGKLRPSSPVTRAEVAKMLFTLW